MAGGHASSRVDSGSLKFRPGVASNRRPISSTPGRPVAFGSSVASTPSRQSNRPPQPSASYSGLTSGSDTEGPTSSRKRVPAVATPRAVASTGFTPGISRSSHQVPQNLTLSPTGVGSSVSASALTTPQVQSRTAVSSSARSAASDLDTPQNGTSRQLPVKPVPRPVFVAPLARPLASSSILGTNLQPASTDGSFLSPPVTQDAPTAHSSTPGPSMPHAQPIQIGQTHHISGIPLPTPPPTQVPLPFPLDPSLGGPTSEFHDFLGDPDGPSTSSVHPMAPEPDAPRVAELENTIFVPMMAQDVNDMPPPPPLPQEAEPSALETTDADGQGEGEPSTTPKRRKAPRAAKPVKDDQPKKRRKRSQAVTSEQTEDDADEETSEKPKRKRTKRLKGPKKVVTIEDRISELEKHAAEAMEQGALSEPLDPTNATMASLCEADLPTGRLSSKFLEKGVAYVKHVEERRQRIMERTADRVRKLRASGLDPDDPNHPPSIKKPEPTPAPDAATNNPTAGPSTRRELGASLSPSPEPEREPAETFAESAAAPQIRFVNGEMVLDEDSQFYDRTAAAQARQDEDSMVVVDEADSTRFSNSASFSKREGAKGAKWTADETEMFYWCLSAFGEDYENIARYLGRTPGQCKNKTKAEDRKGNEKRITLAIKTRIPLDLEEFGRITGRDFSGPPPEIRAPTVPPQTERQEERQEPAMVGARVKTTNSAPTTPRKKDKAPLRDGEEEIMTLEEYERDGKDD
ncbi:Transcription factor TFIIIB component B [Ceratobasidium sp. 395]|nr:Transcription factor TFIIIB component B [Ceratobasidium sp. 395]